ncbi:MAG: hypothetical protein QXU82_02675 [Candidatus Aenigmatarchaeota archaeon]
MNELVLVALGFGGIAVSVVLLAYIRNEKGKLRKSVLEYEKIKKKLDENGD